MLKETMKRSPTGGKWLFYAIIAGFIIGMLYFVGGTGSLNFTEHNAVDDMDSLYFAVQSAFAGDIYCFFDGLIDGIPIIALFLVLFSIIHFLFSTVMTKIFSANKNIAVVMSLVVTIYGFVDQRVYNYLLSMNAFAIGLLVFFALLIMMWSFTDRNVRTLDKEFRTRANEYHHHKSMRESMRADKDKIKKYNKMIKELSSKEKEELYKQYAASKN